MGLFSKEPKQYRDSQTIMGKPVPMQVRTVTASAEVIDLTDKKALDRISARQKGSTWQTEAWHHYNSIGEVSFSFNLLASLIGRLRIYSAFIADDDRKPVPLADAEVVEQEQAYLEEAQQHMRELLRMLNMNFGGISGMLEQMTLNYAVAGECYLVGIPPCAYTNGKQEWSIRSSSEVEFKSGKIYVKDSKYAPAVELPNNTYTGRIWNPHPQYSQDPYSSMMSVEEPAKLFLLIDRATRGLVRSRLNAGIVFIPDTLSIAFDVDSDEEPGEFTNDEGYVEAPEESLSFEQVLLDTVSKPIEDETNAASVVPTMITGPETAGNYIRHITFDRPFDQAIDQKGKDAIERVIKGIDAPKEITAIASNGNPRASGSINIDDSLFKGHLEPMAKHFCDSLTSMLARPWLVKQGLPEAFVARLTLWYDATEILTDANKTESAKDAWDRGVISDAEYRAALNFPESGKPSDEERAERVILVRGTPTQTTFDLTIQGMSPKLADQIRAQEQSNSNAPIPAAAKRILYDGDPNTPAPTEATPASNDTAINPDADPASSDSSVAKPQAGPLSGQTPRNGPIANPPSQAPFAPHNRPYMHKAPNVR